MDLTLNQQDLLCLVLGSSPKKEDDAKYLVKTGYMHCTTGMDNYRWRRDALEGLSDISLYGLYNLVKNGDIENHYRDCMPIQF